MLQNKLYTEKWSTVHILKNVKNPVIYTKIKSDKWWENKIWGHFKESGKTEFKDKLIWVQKHLESCIVFSNIFPLAFWRPLILSLGPLTSTNRYRSKIHSITEVGLKAHDNVTPFHTRLLLHTMTCHPEVGEDNLLRYQDALRTWGETTLSSEQ